MTILQADAAPVHETPNATMTTLAAPSLGATDLAVWRARFAPGAGNPLHLVDREQVHVVLTGGVTVEVDGELRHAVAGDTVVIPAGAARRMTNDGDGTAEVLVAMPAGGRVRMPAGEDRGAPPWAS